MKLLITEKPSVAMEFAKVLNVNPAKKNGYLEGNGWIITWCYGHLVTMSYPEVYDEKLKFWTLNTLPFLPREYKYEVIPEDLSCTSQLTNGKKEITVITCTNDSKMRVIVKARAV